MNKAQLRTKNKQRTDTQVLLRQLNPLAAEFFRYPLGARRSLTWHGLSFSMFTVWHGLFSLVLMFPGLRIEGPPLFTIQGNCINTFFKAANQEIQFLLLCTNLVKIHISFCLSKVGSPGPINRPSVPHGRIKRTGLSAFRATKVESSGPIYRPSMLIRQDFWADLSAYRRLMVNYVL